MSTGQISVLAVPLLKPVATATLGNANPTGAAPIATMTSLQAPDWFVKPTGEFVLAPCHQAVLDVFAPYRIAVTRAIAAPVSPTHNELLSVFRDGLHMGMTSYGGVSAFSEELLAKAICELCQVPNLWSEKLAREQTETILKNFQPSLEKFAKEFGVTFGELQGPDFRFGKPADPKHLLSVGLYRDGQYLRDIYVDNIKELKDCIIGTFRNEKVGKLYDVTLKLVKDSDHGGWNETLDIIRNGQVAGRITIMSDASEMDLSEAIAQKLRISRRF